MQNFVIEFKSHVVPLTPPPHILEKEQIVKWGNFKLLNLQPLHSSEKKI